MKGEHALLIFLFYVDLEPGGSFEIEFEEVLDEQTLIEFEETLSGAVKLPVRVERTSADSTVYRFFVPT